jgi:hypothetical protein
MIWTIVKAVFSSGLSFVAPWAAAILQALKVLWASICSAALWCGRQAVAAPAWTSVLMAAVILAWWLSGTIGDHHGYSRGMTDGKSVQTANLNECHNNVGLLEVSLADQNAKIKALSVQGDALRADAAAKVAKVQAENEALRARMAALLAAKPTGKTECERAASARRQIEGDLTP